LQLTTPYFFLKTTVFFTPINSSHNFEHNRIKGRSSKNEYFTRYFTVYVKLRNDFKLYNSKSTWGKIFYYSGLESPWDKLQEYAIKNREFHLRNWRWPSNNSSKSNQWYYVMSPSKPYNFCLKHFLVKLPYRDIRPCPDFFNTQYMYICI